MFLVITGDDDHVDEIDPEILGPFTTRDELLEALPAWVLPPREEHVE